MTPPDPAPSPSRGQEARDAVADVLRDQAARAERRDQAQRPPRDPTPLLWGLALSLGAAAVWLWVAPPAFLQPAPLPEPAPEVVDAELTMTVYQAVLRLQAFHDSAGRLPQALEEAFEGVEDIEGFTYQRLDTDRFRLTAIRGDQLVAYETGDTLAAVAAQAVQTLQQVRR